MPNSKEKNKVFKPKTPPIIREFISDKTSELMAFLLKEMTGYSRNNIKSFLTRRQVAVDGAPIAQYNFLVHPGDKVTVFKYRIHDQTTKVLPILYEDQEFLVINKPCGLLSIASDKESGETAYRIMTDYVRSKNALARLFIVHRIDKETSGVMLFAKNKEVQERLQNLWNDIVTLRGYYAVVEGVLKKKRDTIRTWLHQTSTQLMYSSFKKDDGQEAITHYQVLKETDRYSLLDVTIDTGRKNQIRVHMKDIGHLVVGDDKYHAAEDPLGRLGLHAYALSFKHPDTGKVYTFKAPTPDSFKNLFASARTVEIEHNMKE
jgi:23S rRNA pseudouridine1911/1915/1917 synthase